MRKKTRDTPGDKWGYGEWEPRGGKGKTFKCSFGDCFVGSVA